MEKRCVMRKRFIALTIVGASALAGVVFAQQQPPGAPGATETQATQPPAPAAAPAPKSPLTQWGTDFSFLFDGYVDANFNHPDSGFNQLRNFDFRADTAHV